MLRPKLFTTLQDYPKNQLLADAFSGVIVGIVAIPLAIAFAIASGLSPEKGLLTAIVAGFLISALGGSRVQIGGPTGAFVVIVYDIVQKHGVNGLLLATIIAGLLLVVMGIARLGTAIKFIPRPVVVGFTSGIAVIIFSSQVKDFLGLDAGAVPAAFLQKWLFFLHHLHTLNPLAIAVALSTMAVIFYWPRLNRRIPGPFVALVASILLVTLAKWPIETIGSRFGELTITPHLPQIPTLDISLIQQLLPPALTIALLGGIESLLSAVIADGMIGGRHRSNMELIAGGVANIASGILGGMPATGAVARTVTNIKNGGRTPVAGMVHALTILLIVLFFGRWVKQIPLACLAGILVIVSYHMSEWRSFLSLLKGPRSDAVVLVVTFLITIFVDLTVAIEIGMVLAAFLFMHRMAESTRIDLLSQEIDGQEKPNLNDENAIYKLRVPEEVEVYEINGPFFFGVSQEFEETVRFLSRVPKVRILRLRHVPFIDASGLYSLTQFYKRCQQNKTHLILSGLHTHALKTLKTSDLYDLIGKDNIVPDIQDAIRRAAHLISSSSGRKES